MSTVYSTTDYQQFKLLTMSTMNKKKLLRKAAFESGLSIKDVEKAVDAFLCAVSDILREDGVVLIPDFGKFYIQRRGERVCRNPQTGRVVRRSAIEEGEVQGLRQRDQLQL
jgi:DNA-binding protein HU-beta